VGCVLGWKVQNKWALKKRIFLDLRGREQIMMEWRQCKRMWEYMKQRSRENPAVQRAFDNGVLVKGV
jgi:hypothetical protein